MSFLRRLLGGATRRRITHPVFGQLRYFDLGARSYWEGAVAVPGAQGDVGLGIDAGPDGPTAAQVEFFRGITSDLDALVRRCQPILAAEWQRWLGRSFPEDWREDLTLTDIQVPPNGDESRDWSVSFDSRSDPEHTFTVHFESYRPANVTVDG